MAHKEAALLSLAAASYAAGRTIVFFATKVRITFADVPSLLACRHVATLPFIISTAGICFLFVLWNLPFSANEASAHLVFCLSRLQPIV